MRVDKIWLQDLVHAVLYGAVFGMFFAVLAGCDYAPGGAKDPAVVQPAPNPGDSPAPTNRNQGLLVRHNRYREKAGLAPLVLDQKLCELAYKHSVWMANHNSMSHAGFNDRLRSYDKHFTAAGENVAMGYANIDTVTDGWMGSRGHRRNILGNYDRVGFGMAVSRSDQRYWCAIFVCSSQTRSLSLPELDEPEGLDANEKPAVVPDESSP